MPGTDIPLDKAYLTAIWLETLFYGEHENFWHESGESNVSLLLPGMNFVLFWSCMFVLTIRRRTPHINKLLVAIAVAMISFSTAHVSLGFQRLIEGFIVLRNQPGGPAAFFSDVSIPANVVKVGIHTVNSVIGDSVVVWRCYLVWNKSIKICVVPVLLIIASATCGFAQTVEFAGAKDLHSAFAHELTIWNGSLFTISLATNIIVTSLIALRVWYMLPFQRRYCYFRYWRILLIIIESGMIYSVALICEITLYFLASNAFYIVYDPIAQLTAITPTMILVLAGLNLTSNDVHSRMTRTQLTKPKFTPGTETTDGVQTIPLDTMQFANSSFGSIQRKSILPTVTFREGDESV
ncbi:hypothetical protein A0H81_08691 [Grifola frondosa]|uniref:Uncharacterized protein n=1 Tax=Grifola frondosa TaxID=5627 RepID=A0A1C7M3N3_GRIFR|nr:hypothetical protein A0H81_08691 [Grifola frondosa]